MLTNSFESRCSKPKMNSALKRFIFELCGRKPLKDLNIIEVTEGAGQYGMCNDNVDRVMAENGGQAITGWKVFYNASTGYFTAEFHYIWQSPDDKLIDVTEDPQMPITWFVLDDRFTIDVTATEIFGPSVHLAKRNKPGMLLYLVEGQNGATISKDSNKKMCVKQNKRADIGTFMMLK